MWLKYVCTTLILRSFKLHPRPNFGKNRAGVTLLQL